MTSLLMVGLSTSFVTSSTDGITTGVFTASKSPLVTLPPAFQVFSLSKPMSVCFPMFTEALSLMLLTLNAPRKTNAAMSHAPPQKVVAPFIVCASP